MMQCKTLGSNFSALVLLLLLVSTCSYVEQQPVYQQPVYQYPTANFRIEHGIIFDKNGKSATIKLETGRKLDLTFSESFSIGDRVKVFYKDNKLVKSEIVGISSPAYKAGTQEDARVDSPDGKLVQTDRSADQAGVSRVPQQDTEPAKTRWRKPDKTRALVVGVGVFSDAGIPKISYAADDAEFFRGCLTSSAVPDKNIAFLRNEQGTRNAITDALLKLKMATTDKSETAVFYYSGHGVPIVENGNFVDAVLVPYDATENSIEYTGLRLSTIRDMLRQTMGNWVVILDACFTGKSGRSFLPAGLKGIAVRQRQPGKASGERTGSWWVTSTSADNYANEYPKEKRGLFTWYFVEALKGAPGVDANGDRFITIREAFDWTRNKVFEISTKSLGRPQMPELVGQGDAILVELK